MGDFLNLFDLLLFMYILFMSIALPLIDVQFALPEHMFHPLLVNLKNWYIQEFGDYLVSEKLHFFVGLIWLDLFFAWPLCVLSVYAIAAGKSWINTNCLLYGASTLTSLDEDSLLTLIVELRCYWFSGAHTSKPMVAMLNELKDSERALEFYVACYLILSRVRALEKHLL
ncbi:hypothetical protein BC332_19139 [Capsicum chinense]|nr:hypothetical protein BC332_19139 [Capsicum chinense]